MNFEVRRVEEDRELVARLERGIVETQRSLYRGLIPILPSETSLIGLEETVDKLEKMVSMMVFEQTNLRRFLVGKPPKGVILYGPSGTGKTESVAVVIGRLRKKGRDIEGYIIPTSSFLSSGLGESDRNIDAIFNVHLSEILRKKDKGVILLFDELDGIARQRTLASDPLDRVLNLLFILIDRLESRDRVLLIGTTNRYDLLDEAMKRRLGLAYLEYSQPNEEEREQIWRYFLAKMNSWFINTDFKRLSQVSKGLTGGDIENIVTALCIQHYQDRKITQEDVERTIKTHLKGLLRQHPKA